MYNDCNIELHVALFFTFQNFKNKNTDENNELQTLRTTGESFLPVDRKYVEVLNV